MVSLTVSFMTFIIHSSLGVHFFLVFVHGCRWCFEWRQVSAGSMSAYPCFGVWSLKSPIFPELELRDLL